MSFLGKIKKTIFGYDIFISYSRKDSLDYAYSIARYFMKRGYECYIDQLSSITPGQELPSNIKDAVKRSTAFVLIGSEGGQTSEPIELEIQLFLDNNANKPLIPITIDGAINENARWNKKIVGLALINDTVVNLSAGEPAQDVIDRIENSIKFTKKSTRLRNISIAILLGIIAIFCLTTAFSYINMLKANKAIKQRNQAESQKVSALRDKEYALSDKVKSEKLKRKADSLQVLAQEKADHLDKQSEMLQIRIAARKYLNIDPQIAFRLAEEAYKRSSDAENKKIILETISKIDLYSKYILHDYEVEDFKEPFLLLKKNNLSKKTSWVVFDIITKKFQLLKLNAYKAWLFVDGKSWRILALSSSNENDPSESHPIFQLYERGEKPIYKSVHGRYFGGYAINKNKFGISLLKEPKILIWDIITNEQNYVLDKAENRHESYRLVNVTSNGRAVVRKTDETFLIDKHGQPELQTSTKISVDELYMESRWSADENFLALNNTDINSLGIWDLNGATYKQLDLHGWVLNAYSWSNDGHLIAFAGRNENEINVTIEILDARIPETSRKVIYKGSTPIKSIVFLNKDKSIAACDNDGNIYIIQIFDRQIVQTGFQKNINKLFVTSTSFVSESLDDIRMWSINPPPSKYWNFQSDTKRTYLQDAAADPTNVWLAALCRVVDTTKGADFIELRKEISGETKFLSTPKATVSSFEFSGNGKWLLLVVTDTLRIWYTKTWDYYDYPLHQGNGQSITLKLNGDTAVAHVTEGYANDSLSEYEYIIHLGKSLKRPILIKSVLTKDYKNKSYRIFGKELLKQVDGWDIQKDYKFQSSGLSSAPGSGWVVSVKCRDFYLGAKDCDVQFIPMNIQTLFSLYDNLLPKLTKEELNKYSFHK